MNNKSNSLSSLQQILCEKETELSRIRQAVADAAQQQEEEAKGHLLHMIESMEREMEHTRQECELTTKNAIHQVEHDAVIAIEGARKEMEQSLQQREDEIFKAAHAKMEEEWLGREEHLRQEFENILSEELEEQHCKLYESIMQDKDELIKAKEDEMKLQLGTLEEQHQQRTREMHREMEVVADEIWNDACQQFTLAADDKISQSLAFADEQCEARDEQISMLLEERTVLQKTLDEKDTILERQNKDLAKMKNESKDSESKVHSRYEKEMTLLSDEATKLAYDNEQLKHSLHETESENDLLTRKLTQCQLEIETLNKRNTEQKQSANTFDTEKQRFESRIGELSACNQLLQRQLSDMKEENKDLATSSKSLKKRIDNLVQVNEELSTKEATLKNHINELQQKNGNLERRQNDSIARIHNLEQEQREYMREMEHRIKQKDKMLADTLDSLNTGSKPRSYEPVVVHLHGNNNDSANASNHDRLSLSSVECTNLRSKVLQLQRENFRLEKELMSDKNIHRDQSDVSNNNHDSDGKNGTAEIDALQQENNSLKTIVSLMRKEMETTVATTANGEGTEKSTLPSDLLIEQQLLQCRSYLELLLRKKVDENLRGFGGSDEVSFLRSKYQELHRTADELREENARLHMMCNSAGLSGGNNYDDSPTRREQELIQKLEEATDEIEELLLENEKLMMLSNELRFELQQTKSRHQSSSRTPHQMRCNNDDKTLEEGHEETILDALLNDQSRSCEESESHESSEVACVGRKPPLSSANDSRPFKTAYGSQPTTASDRATTSQRQSFQRLLNRKKKEVAVEKTKIRNWNVKDPSTNPYLS